MNTVTLALSVALAAGLLPAQSQPAAPGGFFIQMSDPQFGMYTSNGGFSQETANFEFAIAAANRLKPRFVIVTGDLVNRGGDEAQVAEYLRIAHRLDPSIRLLSLPGNHDAGNTPTVADLDRYRKNFGPDYYSFREGSLYGIGLNSALLAAPQAAPEEARKQDQWLEAELEKAAGTGNVNIVVFMHHPPFLERADEPDQYFNIPEPRRQALLDSFHRAGVRWVFAGHLHRNAVARHNGLTVVTSGPVGKPLGEGLSGIRLVWFDSQAVSHQYFDFGHLPADAGRPQVSK